MKRAALLALLLGASSVMAAPAPMKADRKVEKEKLCQTVLLGLPLPLLGDPCVACVPQLPAFPLPPRVIPPGWENADPPLED
jgi:hypothetical protein